MTESITVERYVEAIECPECGLYAKSVDTTKEEDERYGCFRDKRFHARCCARAFECKNGHRTGAYAEAPEMA